MKTQIMNMLSRFQKDEDGATLVEYGIALTLAITLGTGAFLTLAGDVDAEFASASTVLKANDTTTTN